MLFLQVFRSLQGKKVTIEMKNGIVLRGTLQTADQFYNFKLIDIEVLEGNYPQVYALATAFIRGSSVNYVHLPPEEIDLDLLHDATRRHNQGSQ